MALGDSRFEALRFGRRLCEDYKPPKYCLGLYLSIFLAASVWIA